MSRHLGSKMSVCTRREAHQDNIFPVAAFERGDYATSTKSVTKELIAKESKYNNIAQSSESATQFSCALSTIMSTRDSYNEDSKLRSAESSDSKTFDLFDKDSPIDIKDVFDVSYTLNKKLRRPYDPTIDERLPKTVTLLTTPNGGKLYLVGTAHFSVESQNDVSKIIQAVQPHVVVIELCRARVDNILLDEKAIFQICTKNIDYKTIMDNIKEKGFCIGLLHTLLRSCQAHIAKQLGIPAGGEFRRAIEEAKKVPNCIVYLGDRPIDITMQRTKRLLSWWQVIILFLGCIMGIIKIPITQKDVEFIKQRSIEGTTLANMKESPELEEVIVKERDIYLTNSLQLALQVRYTQHRTADRTFKPTRVVGIVGLGHKPGIIENWGKVKSDDIPPIMKIPPPSLSDRILKLTVNNIKSIFFSKYWIYLISFFMGQYICGYCNCVLKEDQIQLHLCLNIYDKNEQVLVSDENRHIFIQDIENCNFDKENDAEEDSTGKMENKVIEEMDSNNNILIIVEIVAI